MFQAAFHPTSFTKHNPDSAGSLTPNPPVSPTIQLPRKLARPEYAEVSSDAITAAAPELASVTPEYVRQLLRPKEAEMHAGLNALAPSHIPNSLPKSHLPSHLTIPLRHVSSPVPPTYPTHALAVYSSRSSSDSRALIIPVHSLVLAAHCARLPTLPKPFHYESSSRVQIPVIPVSLPSPHAFTIIRKFLYTHSLESVLKSLIPVPSNLQSLSRETVRATMASHSTLHQLAKYLCEASHYNMQTVTTHAAHVKDFWQDIVSLGIHDAALWDTLDLAWEIVLGALTASTKRANTAFAFTTPSEFNDIQIHSNKSIEPTSNPSGSLQLFTTDNPVCVHDTVNSTSPVSIENQCLMPEDAINWLLQNEDVLHQAKQLDCYIMPNICSEPSISDGWANILCLHGSRNKEVAEFALELAAKSGISVYWIFEDDQDMNVDEDAMFNTVAYQYENLGIGGGDKDNSHPDTEPEEQDQDQQSHERNGGDGRKNDSPKQKNNSSGSKREGDNNSRSNKDGDDCSQEREDSEDVDGDKSGPGSKTNGHSHEVILTWSRHDNRKEVVSVRFKLTFETDVEKVKENRYCNQIIANGEFELKAIQGSNYKVGMCTSISAFASEDASAITIRDMPNPEDRGIRKFTHNDTSDLSISGSIRNPIVINASHKISHGEEVTNSASTPSFYVYQLPPPNDSSVAIGIFPTPSLFSRVQPIHIPELGLGISLRAGRSQRPKIDIGIKICLRMETKEIYLATEALKGFSIPKGLILVQTITIKDAYAPVESTAKMRFILPDTDSSSLEHSIEFMDKAPKDSSSLVLVEAGKAYSKGNLDNKKIKDPLRTLMTKIKKLVPGQNNNHARERDALQKLLEYTENLFKDVEVKMVKISVANDISVQPVDKINTMAAMPVDEVRPQGFGGN
ncbi:hypothetical protein VKT23_017835 [Stygiomarasmius scandens]|uniref:Uncharacterized protein n=1 Tax=Marasmiellus scandens TaxID=2682957 RepID=A0ABR1ITD3_9AGAR